ncbi:MAG: DNA-directed RNA polymerase subunit omega [Epsilonproteobacteria bacterium]|nr:MAG: DNA-directed RNA polymerase subunit omega [Campylobacterota bacterium]
MRIEEIVSEALDKVGNDRYILSLAVGQRADELSKGAKPLLENSTIKNMKYTDIAIKEIASGVLVVEGVVDND